MRKNTDTSSMSTNEQAFNDFNLLKVKNWFNDQFEMICLINSKHKFKMTSSVFKPTVLEGKCAFITGGATGICYGIAQAYLEHGCKVAIASRKTAVITKAVEELKKLTKSEHIYGFTCDIRKPEQVEKAILGAV